MKLRKPEPEPEPEAGLGPKGEQERPWELVRQRRPNRPVVTIVVPDWAGALVVLAAAFGVVAGGGLGYALARAPEAGALVQAPRTVPSPRFWRSPRLPTAEPGPIALDQAAPGRPAGSAEDWPHDVFASVRDPNVLQAGFAPARIEDAPPDAPIAAPRLAVGGFDAALTRDLGTLAAGRPTTTTIAFGNVGGADLVIERVYFGTSGLGFAPGGPLAADATGSLRAPLVLAPGETVPITLAVDPRRLTARGTQALYLQLFTNDPQLEPFEPGASAGREGRVRLVLTARPAEDLERPIGPAEVPLAAGSPRAWLPDLVRDGRGDDLVVVGEVPATEPFALDLAVANLGDAPLTLSVDPATLGLEAEIDDRVVAPFETTAVHMLIELSPGLDDGQHFRRTLRLRTDDPLAPGLAIDIVGRWAAPAPADPPSPGQPAPLDS